MTYLGTRPILPDELEQYELHHRARIAIKPGIRIAAKESETDRDRILSASFHGKTKKWDAEVTGEDGWENSFADMSSIFIPAKEILSHSYNLNAATEKNNVRFDDTYLDIINAAKINISAGRNSASKEAMLKIIEKMTQGTVLMMFQSLGKYENFSGHFLDCLYKYCIMWLIINRMRMLSFTFI